MPQITNETIVSPPKPLSPKQFIQQVVMPLVRGGKGKRTIKPELIRMLREIQNPPQGVDLDAVLTVMEGMAGFDLQPVGENGQRFTNARAMATMAKDAGEEA